MPNRQQAIILTNADLIHIYAVQGGDELIYIVACCCMFTTQIPHCCSPVPCYVNIGMLLKQYVCMFSNALAPPGIVNFAGGKVVIFIEVAVQNGKFSKVPK